MAANLGVRGDGPNPNEKTSPLDDPGSGTPNTQGSNPDKQPSPALRNAYLHIATITTNTILRIKTIDTLLSALTTSIKDVYSTILPKSQTSDKSTDKANEKARNAYEIKIAFGGPFPEAFKPIIVELFRADGLLAAVREDIEPAKLFFADFSLLEVNEDKATPSIHRISVVFVPSQCKEFITNSNPPKESSKMILL
ncbi:hypothetical protein M7I_5551 [Glarea lozoyensis 74030]|uniref:Uncharacterized protein n=1 Tax=Glarea lozoyensis (strain ATCC 74030 / MF5533) TaxID=1104152 RepID=H0ES73_GLAL7|nr:hypothetical protein M7I_5551 [Glarea lozoyensis 74030]